MTLPSALSRLFDAYVARHGLPAALLVDLDGTLVDTMGLHHRAYAAILAQYGGTLTRAAFDRIVGPPAAITIPQFVTAAGLSPAALPDTKQLHRAKKDALQAMVRGAPPAALPAADLVRALPDSIPVALVTSSNREGATMMLEAIGLADRFATIVSGEDVARGKPDPEPYRLALARLGVDAALCLALEDHPDGIASALAAGITVIDVTGPAVRETA